jgi:hypothetical protein
VRVGGVENRLSESDRLARTEAKLAAHDALFTERERAEGQAQREREISAEGVQTALQAAAKSTAEALEAALESADKIEKERIGRVEDAVESIKESTKELDKEKQLAQNKFEENVKDRFASVNEFRASLEDLGKSMGTRRELEQLQETQNHSVQTVSKEVIDMSNRIDIGHKNLTDLQTKSNQNYGEEMRGQRISNTVIGYIGIVIIIVSLIMKFA